jgi:fucose 4-O-acetylase-like acetyltransferase
MADDNKFRHISRKTWYRWSFYINIVLFFIVALFIYLLVIDCLNYNAGSYTWLSIARDIGFLSIALALIFFQFFRNLLTIMRRSL